MVNFGLLTAEIGSGIWGTAANFNGFHVSSALLHGTLVVWASAKLCSVEQRAPPISGRAAITLGIGSHSSFFFFSSPILSGWRLDVYHTSTHDVALVWIYDAGLKCATCDSLKIQDAKKSPKIRHLGIIAQLCRAVSLQLRHVSTIGKNHVKQQYLLHMCPQYGELRHNSGWDRSGSLGHPS